MRHVVEMPDFAFGVTLIRCKMQVIRQNRT